MVEEIEKKENYKEIFISDILKETIAKLNSESELELTEEIIKFIRDNKYYVNYEKKLENDLSNVFNEFEPNDEEILVEKCKKIAMLLNLKTTLEQFLTIYWGYKRNNNVIIKNWIEKDLKFDITKYSIGEIVNRLEQYKTDRKSTFTPEEFFKHLQRLEKIEYKEEPTEEDIEKFKENLRYINPTQFENIENFFKEEEHKKKLFKEMYMTQVPEPFIMEPVELTLNAIEKEDKNIEKFFEYIEQASKSNKGNFISLLRKYLIVKTLDSGKTKKIIEEFVEKYVKKNEKLKKYWDARPNYASLINENAVAIPNFNNGYFEIQNNKIYFDIEEKCYCFDNGKEVKIYFDTKSSCYTLKEENSKTNEVSYKKAMILKDLEKIINSQLKVSQEEAVWRKACVTRDQFDYYPTLTAFEAECSSKGKIGKYSFGFDDALNSIVKSFDVLNEIKKNKSDYEAIFDKMKYDEYKKLSYSLIIQKKGSIKPHPYWQMGHKSDHDYKAVYDTYMLSDKIGTQTFVNIFQNPEYYEPQTPAFNEGHVGDKFMSLEDLVRMFVETDVNVTEEDLKKEMTGEGENQTRKFTDKEIKRIIEFNNVIKENTPSKKETEENKNE